jgi:hypothetical protein
MALRSQDLSSPPREAIVYRFPATRLKEAARSALAPLLVVLVLSLVLWSSLQARPYSSGSRPGAPEVVVVTEGQTLWSLSQRYAPLGVDWRAYSDAVVALNDLSGALQAGQRLRLPQKP